MSSPNFSTRTMIVAAWGCILMAATGSAAEPARYKDRLTGRDIPDDWFWRNGLSFDDPLVPLRDPDQDGFTNEDEWRANTDPNNKESHPPYHTKLFLDRCERVPFRFILKTYEIDRRKAGQETTSFQIDTIDLRQPSLFLKLGDILPSTPYKLEKFVQKMTPGSLDVSELTLVNIQTGEKCLLVLNQVTDSPDVFARFAYEWIQPGTTLPQMIRVKAGQEFVLKPLVDDQHHYKLIEVNDKEARIQTLTGEIYVVKPDPRRPVGD